MKDVMFYKDYISLVHYSTEDEVFYGELEAFEEAVEDYLELCRLNGKEPEKVYKGSFNVKIKPELHKKAAQMATIGKDGPTGTFSDRNGIIPW
ncbi:type II toxin-antitoxin system HicB family antitoxin [Desulfitobacterium chlororespirans]|uniref:Predicted nuclease of the RNAse H fold, HicB family n=1 Tax=Desulfitobacterium chlororespirans DSM 11544 TaxID=1121395 RepID=A0A1M7UZV8_9FIRM|nr:type II toxin-antitoxin system HicB family antitoxin [Desulfitobacterium chlororespirans]SHN88509.1 Predicted nuclease of the RNAse H fold, HicB family [Desulfitobacterium chlororespirans DSM 11544]